MDRTWLTWLPISRERNSFLRYDVGPGSRKSGSSPRHKTGITAIEIGLAASIILIVAVNCIW